MPAETTVRGDWLAFGAGTPEAEAVERFVEKYGCEPASAIHSRGLLLVGPVHAARPKGALAQPATVGSADKGVDRDRERERDD